jgi:hypothetical protein
MTKIAPNVHVQWHPLKVLMVGKSYGPEYYEPIKNSRVRDSLQLIAEQTEEDFQGLIRTVKSFGADIVRVEPGDRNIEIDIANNQRYHPIPKSPMTPRDNAVVLGDRILITDPNCVDYTQAIYKHIDYKHIINPWAKYTNPELGTWGLEPNKSFHAPSITRVGNTIFVDNNDHPWLVDYFRTNLPDYNIVEVTIGGHNDGAYSPIAPGKILSIIGQNHYQHTFPNWEVLYLPNQSWNLVKGWNQLKSKNDGKWWIDGQDINNDLTEFVETWLTDWVGYVEETVFDVNCLVLDQHHVCFTNYNKEVWEFCQRNQIEPIVVPFRHRFFWDGGLHCVTLDLVRDGNSDDYVRLK